MTMLADAHRKYNEPPPEGKQGKKGKTVNPLLAAMARGQ